VEEVLYQGTSAFQEVEVVRTVPFGSLLITDGLMQSSEHDEYVYHESLVHPALTAHGNPKRVFIGGGGEGATLREVLRHPSVEECVMVDIDGDVVNMCREHTPFYSAGAYEDSRTRLVIGDAKGGLESEPDGSFDVIIMDLSDPLDGGPCYQLYTTDFYRILSKKLAPGGIFVTQSGCASVRDAHHVFSPINHTLKQVFPKVYGYTMCVPSFTSEWGFNLAVNDENIDLSGAGVDDVLAARGLSMKFYDAISHRRMFALPKPLRTLIDSEKRVMTVENPLFMCSTDTHAGIFEG
jgi:thermospermine synthase|tara:strand:+ start:4561 stop:5442 length:882 start_codon:yes stop_codon:yes gene_type:complete